MNVDVGVSGGPNTADSPNDFCVLVLPLARSSQAMITRCWGTVILPQPKEVMFGWRELFGKGVLFG
jgi:hypothetical protein